jgi:uncharacterized damage-inducible protein DinB
MIFGIPSKNFRKGAIGASMDEYERAVLEYKSLIDSFSEEDFAQIIDHETENEDCRSVQTITSHVIAAGNSYANYIREQFSMNSIAVEKTLLSCAEASDKLIKMLDYTIETLDGKWEMTGEEIKKIVIHTRWGVIYDIDQLLEHAIVHVLKHRRQTEKFLLQYFLKA